MFDSSGDIKAFHNDKVTLPQSERTRMRDRRNSARDRLKRGLEDNGDPQPVRFIKQGSYAMLTMVQDPDSDYDIDDGVYFAETDLEGAGGEPMTPTAVREMVCEALDGDDRFAKPPTVKNSCVRVLYRAGYHVDFPVYRIRQSDGEYELASGDDWAVSRAADVEAWFNHTNFTKSPDDGNGRQFRRIVRLLKKFARSRSEWKAETVSGFVITKLAEETYQARDDRDDLALRDVLQSIYMRLSGSLQVYHPVTPNVELTAGPGDPAPAFFRDRVKEAVDDLAVLDDANCSTEDAAAAWDTVFDSDFFSQRLSAKAAESSAVGLGNLFTTPDPRAVQKQGGGRYA